jgi:hypothetical protein
LPTDTPLPDLSGAVLRPADLPAGYEPVVPGQYGLQSEALSQPSLAVQSLSAYVNPNEAALVMGFTLLMPTSRQQGAFDDALQDPEQLLGALLGGLERMGLSSVEPLADLPQVGVSSGGLTAMAYVNEVPLRVDVQAFRRGVAGAVALVFYPEGGQPPLSVSDVARTLDARLQELLTAGR